MMNGELKHYSWLVVVAALAAAVPLMTSNDFYLRVLFLIGVRMIFPRPEGLMGETPGGEPFIVPLAIPLVAGPSGMAAVMLEGGSEPDRLGDWSLALLLAWAATAAILISATVLYKWLGRSVLTAIERLMGMLLVAISVQMVLDGVGTYLKLTPPNI